MIRALSLALAITALVAADGPPTIIREASDEQRVAELMGVLTYCEVDLRCEALPARDAISELSRLAGIPIVGRYADEPVGYGIEPDTPVDLDFTGAPVLNVLEEILEQCSEPDAECTWQIRRGFVEVGTKTRLSVPAACETRTYYIADLIMDIPDFGGGTKRKRREVLAVDLVQKVVETIEPDAWDYGQIDYDEDVRDVKQPSVPTSAAGSASAATTPPDPSPARPTYVTPRKIATIRYWRDILIVHAPDYIHRELVGYPTPIRPESPDVRK